MNYNINDRFSKAYTFIIAVCVILILRIVFLNLVRGQEYREISQNSIYKKIVLQAPRGEIRDRNGVLLAGNKPVFAVKISKQANISAEHLNDVCLKLYNILEKNNEDINDEFPIVIENGQYTFTFDKYISEFKKQNHIPENFTAYEALMLLVDKANAAELTKIDKSESNTKIQQMLNEHGIYPPISVGERVEFTKELEKEQWLYGYGITDKNIPAKAAFAKVRDFVNIDENLTDDEAHKILVITDAIKSKGYLQYEPVTVASNISQTTVSYISENQILLDGVSLQVEPLRYYPQGNLASHSIGQIGNITNADEDLLKDKRYSENDIVGKSGIEKAFESKLKGESGYKEVQTNATGKKIADIDYKDPVSGYTVYTSIDAKLQKIAEDSLERTIKAVRTGGTFKSKWGNFKVSAPAPNAKSGAIVVLDVNTGKVLAMASYPDYDPNIFTKNLTKSEYDALQPENPNDPLSPKPQFNIATMTNVQPGSVFKMITGLAALEEGLDPDYIVPDKGVIKVGGRSFGTFAWNQHKALQGNMNMVKALRDSNNYYFYCISVGHNYATDQPIPGLENMDVRQIINMAKKFGLDKKTGIEIYEVPGMVPDENSKYNITKKSLERDIYSRMDKSFTDINSSNRLYNKRVNEIISWIDENPSRAEIIKRLRNMKVKEEQVEKIADLIKYTYFNSAQWTTGDIFNISIGQGANAYTPLQIANYVAAIANGGKLNKISIIEKTVDPKTGSEYIVEPESSQIILKNMNHLAPIKEGMLAVSRKGTAKQIFGDFPIDIASKTGTAEKEGYVPTKDEEQYLLSHLSYYDVKYADVMKLAKSYAKKDGGKYDTHVYIRSAIMELNKSLTHDDIDRFKPGYDSFGWYVGFAPYDNPKIAVATIIFQAGSGVYSALPSREVIAQYLGLNKDEVKLNSETTSAGIVTKHKAKSLPNKYDYFGNELENYIPLNSANYMPDSQTTSKKEANNNSNRKSTNQNTNSAQNDTPAAAPRHPVSDTMPPAKAEPANNDNSVDPSVDNEVNIITGPKPEDSDSAD